MVWSSETFWLRVRSNRGLKSYSFSQSKLIRNHTSVQNGSCVEFSTMWIRDTIHLLKTGNPFDSASIGEDKMETITWMRMSLYNPVSSGRRFGGLPHHEFLSAYGVSQCGISETTPTMNTIEIAYHLSRKNTGYLIHGANHTVAAHNGKGMLRFFDPNFGSCAFHTIPDLVRFLSALWRDNYTDGETFVESFC